MLEMVQSLALISLEVNSIEDELFFIFSSPVDRIGDKM